MDRCISRMTGHNIICGWGRVGTASAQHLTTLGRDIVVVDRDPERLRDIEHPTVIGDVTDDRTLEAAGISHAQALISALDTDADNVYVTLSSRALRPDLIIIARARNEGSMSKLLRASANRVVNGKPGGADAFVRWPLGFIGGELGANDDGAGAPVAPRNVGWG